MGKRIYNKLAWLNELPHEDAIRVFEECGGDRLWAERMAAERPFPMLEQLFEAAKKFARTDEQQEVERQLTALLEQEQEVY